MGNTLHLHCYFVDKHVEKDFFSFILPKVKLMFNKVSFPIAHDRKKLSEGRMVFACHPRTLEAEGRKWTL